MSAVDKKIKRKNKVMSDSKITMSNLLKETAEQLDKTIIAEAENLLNEVAKLKVPFEETLNNLDENSKGNSEVIISEIKTTTDNIREVLSTLKNMTARGLVEADLDVINENTMTLLGDEVKLSTLISDFAKYANLTVSLG